MSQMGIGAMLGYLSGNSETIQALEQAKGKTIRSACVSTLQHRDGALHLGFDDKSILTLRDDGRSCCENRYIRTDDDLGSFVGAQFMGAELREGPTVTTEWGEPHDQQFLLINTSLGTFTVCTHNEHNGYYGGFWMVAELRENDDTILET